MGPDDAAAIRAIAMLQEFSRLVNKAHNLRVQLPKMRKKDSADQQLKEINTELELANKFSEVRTALSLMSEMVGSLGGWVIASDKGRLRRDHGVKSLSDNAHSRHWKAIQLAIAKGEDIQSERGLKQAFNEVDVLGRTALHYAAARPVSRNIIEQCLTYGVSINQKDILGLTALQYAVISGNKCEGNVKLLLLSGADKEQSGRDGMTALHYAARRGSELMTQILLEAGANIHAQDNGRRTPLHWAAAACAPEVISALIKQGANPDIRDRHGRFPLYLVCTLNPRDDLSASNCESCINQLVKADDKSPQKIAREGGFGNLTALHLAAFNGNISIVKILLEHRVKLNDKKATKSQTITSSPLHLAARNGHAEIIGLLLDWGDLIEVKDDMDRTALHWAAEGGHVEVVEVLLDRQDRKSVV